ncbi:MAG TPA: type III secretion system chaperone [Parachlamydiaceae bacterium]|nr:type III secretion system chaperone [Parachlamydiaceae bacterium]
MKPDELLKLLEVKTSISPLNFSSEGVVSFIFNDEFTTHLEKSKDDHSITIYGIVGMVPIEQSELCLHALLDANLFGRDTAGSSFGIEREKGEIILFRTLELQNLQSDYFFDTLKQFSLTQEHWTRYIEHKSYNLLPHPSKESGKNISQFGNNFLKL